MNDVTQKTNVERDATSLSLGAILRERFGHRCFRPNQEDVCAAVTSGCDGLLVMPTGSGKSLCYQLPALRFEGVTLVISPLIALMKDQVDALKSCGISAEFINSSLSINEIREICARAKTGEIKILYVAPERFYNKAFTE